MTRRALGALVTMMAALTSCGSSSNQVDVFAASSLTDAFIELERLFEADNPDIDIRLTFAGSNTLSRQIEDGAPADVFAPADLALAESVSLPDHSAEDLAAIRDTVSVFAVNQLTFVVPAGRDETDLVALFADADAVVARCASGVPCGDATDQFLATAGVELRRATEEANVRDVLTKVRLGQADGGFVYRTDVLAADGDVIELPLADPPRVLIPVVTVSLDDANARAFAAFISSDRAADVLDATGFLRP